MAPVLSLDPLKAERYMHNIFHATAMQPLSPEQDSEGKLPSVVVPTYKEGGNCLAERSTSTESASLIRST